MLEAVLALVSVLALSAGAWAWTAVAPEALLLAGLWCVGAGLGFGLPTGLVYHVELRRALAARGELPPRWWLHPIGLHPLLPPEHSFRVLTWCRLGALGCAVAFLGCGVFALGAVRFVLAGP
jgi:hypothetical protein